MRRSFRISRSSLMPGGDALLMSEVVGHTGSENEAESILRSLRRLGSDGSIGHYEIVPTPDRRSSQVARPVVWSVRAVRD